jgi:hypothetical protein
MTMVNFIVYICIYIWMMTDDYVLLQYIWRQNSYDSLVGKYIWRQSINTGVTSISTAFKNIIPVASNSQKRPV